MTGRTCPPAVSWSAPAGYPRLACAQQGTTPMGGFVSSVTAAPHATACDIDPAARLTGQPDCSISGPLDRCDGDHRAERQQAVDVREKLSAARLLPAHAITKQ